MTPPHDLLSTCRFVLNLAEILVSMALSAAIPVSLVVFAVLTL